MNTSNNLKRILCFGDSNTWGYIPNSKHNRYSPSIRWTGILQNLLGSSYEIIEEGLNSRGILNGDNRPGKEGRNAMDYIIPCLDTQDPLDYVIVLLGTNELKAELNLSPEEIGENLKTFLNVISQRPSQFREEKPKLILVNPPVLNENTEYALKGDKYKGATEKSLALGIIFEKIANDIGAIFVNIQDKLGTGEDGVHMLPESHEILGKELYKIIINLK
jgi:lysophospholipase L1-like esterase